MTLSDELARLRHLHESGALTDDEFARAKDTLLREAQDRAASAAVTAVNALRRSRSDRWIAGVCGGVAVASGLEAWVVRLIFAVLMVWGGAGLVFYILLWIFVPVE